MVKVRKLSTTGEKMNIQRSRPGYGHKHRVKVRSFILPAISALPSVNIARSSAAVSDPPTVSTATIAAYNPAINADMNPAATTFPMRTTDVVDREF